MASNSVLANYTALFSNWDSKVVGPKPTAEQLEQVAGLGLRHGKQALACAMSLRPDGVTGKQIVIACGAPQLNRMRGLIAEGMFKRMPVSANGENHTVYKNTVTPKGLAEIKRIAAVLAKSNASTAAPPKAAKAKGVVKQLGRKANAAKATVPPEAAKPEVSTKANPESAAAVAAALQGKAMGDLPASLKR